MSGEPQPQIPDKLYFKIGEVSKLVGVKPYVLRYWETEFKEIGPTKSRSNQRLYRRRDVDALLAIKNLLYTEGFTITGARKKIREHLKAGGKGPDKSAVAKPRSLPSTTATKLEQIPLAFEGEQSKKLFIKVKRELEELKEIIQASY